MRASRPPCTCTGPPVRLVRQVAHPRPRPGPFGGQRRRRSLPGKRSAVTGFADRGPRVRLRRPNLRRRMPRALSRPGRAAGARGGESCLALWYSGSACLDPAKVFLGLRAPAHLALSTHLCSPMLRISFPTWSNSEFSFNVCGRNQDRVGVEASQPSSEEKQNCMEAGIPFSDASWTCGHGAFGKTVRPCDLTAVWKQSNEAASHSLTATMPSLPPPRVALGKALDKLMRFLRSARRS